MEECSGKEEAVRETAAIGAVVMEVGAMVGTGRAAVLVEVRAAEGMVAVAGIGEGRGGSEAGGEGWGEGGGEGGGDAAATAAAARAGPRAAARAAKRAAAKAA